MTPTRAAGLARLNSFIPRAGTAYAAQRNFDYGPGAHKAVSGLSPFLAQRLLSEDEVIEAVAERHGATAAEKFIQEVLWRTYWKGWMEQRPVVWQNYQAALAAQSPKAVSQAAAVATGGTGIACMDAWAEELVTTGYLHNHARMWFASIWCFTLRLPWQLGADLFHRHLLDADAASNTLSWRWVAGLQTRGKNYVARAENIARYTNGRFNPVGELNESPLPLTSDLPEPRKGLPVVAPAPAGRAALLLHTDDLLPETLPLKGAEIVAIGGISPPSGASPLAAAFLQGALADGLLRAGQHFAAPAAVATDAAAWAVATGCNVIITPYAPVGPVADQLSVLEGDLAPLGIRLHRILRPWDRASWQHATGSFFGFYAAYMKAASPPR